jgi:hypothetical protein
MVSEHGSNYVNDMVELSQKIENHLNSFWNIFVFLNI